MQVHKFEWDDNKAVQNQAVHHVSFDVAREAFGDPFAVDWLDEREGLRRESLFIAWNGTGTADIRLLHDEI